MTQTTGQAHTTADTRPEFPDELIALGQHMKSHPGLPKLYQIGGHGEYSTENRCMSVYLSSGSGYAALVAWTRTLSSVDKSYADRYAEDGVNVHVVGRIGDQRLDVYVTVPADVFPPELGRHEWDVTALLEA